MNKEPLLDPMPITQAFMQLQVKRDGEKIRRNTADDHGLKAQGYYYLAADNDILHPAAGWIARPGKPLHRDDWHCRYVQPAKEITKACLPLCLEGAIGSFELKRWKDPDRVVLLFRDSTGIASYWVCELSAETLFQKIALAGIEFDHHESDLYIKDTPEAREILEQFELQNKNAQRFTSEIDKTPWIDVPFSYEPFWIKRCGRD